MSETPENPVVAVTLDREYFLRYSQRTRFRLNALGDAYLSATDFAQVCMMFWALIDEKNIKQTPEDFAEHITDDNMAEVVDAINKASALSDPSKQKKSSKAGPSSGSQSD